MRTTAPRHHGARAHDRRLRRLGDRWALAVRLGPGRRRRLGRRHPARASSSASTGSTPPPSTGSATRRRSSGARSRRYRAGEDVFVFTKCGRSWDGRPGRRDRERPAPGLDPRGVRAEPAPAWRGAHRPLPVPLARLDDGHARSRSPGRRWPSSSTRARCAGSASRTSTSTSSSAARRVRHVDSLQPPLSLLARGARTTVIPWAAEHGTGVIVYSPMASGLLTGSFDRERVASLDPRRLASRQSPPFQEPLLVQQPRPRRAPAADRGRASARRPGARRRVGAGPARA